MPKPVALSDQTLKHWGLLAAPFSPDFFYRHTAFKTFTGWMSRICDDGDRLHLVRSEIGSGVASAFEQFAACSGIEGRAIDAHLTRWTEQPVRRMVDEAKNRFALASECGIAAVWLIHAFRPSQVTALRHRFHRDPELLANTTTIVRIEDNASTRLAFEDLQTFSFARAESSELANAVSRSMQCAGATRTILDDSAIEQLVRISKGTFRELVDVTHRSLVWGHVRNQRVLSVQAVLECFGSEIEVRRSSRHAA